MEFVKYSIHVFPEKGKNGFSYKEYRSEKKAFETAVDYLLKHEPDRIMIRLDKWDTDYISDMAFASGPYAKLTLNKDEEIQINFNISVTWKLQRKAC